MDIRKIIKEEVRKVLYPMGAIDAKLLKKSKEDDTDVEDAEEIEEIDLSIGHSTGPKPGPGRKFPEENPEGGHSLNLSVSDGPHQFPQEEDL